MSKPTIAMLLAHGAAMLERVGIATAQLDAQVLLAAACGLDRTALFTAAPRQAASEHIAAFDDLLRRRAAREPLPYIVGVQEFWSLDFHVTPDVLIPRPETELLVELGIEAGTWGWGLGASLRAPSPQPQAPRICDVGTGSACIAVALASEMPAIEILAIDSSAAALDVARANARRHSVDTRIRFRQGDLLDGVSDRFHLIVSNPPYVALADRPDLQPELEHEPTTALFAGVDGLDVIRRLLPQALDKLEAGGTLLMEIGSAQANDVTHLAAAAGFREVTVQTDLAGLARVLVAGK